MPAKSDFSIRKLIPQRQRADSDSATHQEHRKTGFLQPKPIVTGRRGSADPAMFGGIDSHSEIDPVPLPDGPYSCPNPPFARQPRDFARATSARTSTSPSGFPRSMSPARSSARGCSRSWTTGEINEHMMRAPTPILRAPSPSPLSREENHVTAEDIGKDAIKALGTPVLKPEPAIQRPSRPSTPVRPERPAQRPSRPSSPLILPDISVPDRRSSIVPVTILPVKEEVSSPKREKTSPAKVPVRKASVKKNKRKPRNATLSPKKPGRHQPRWTFTENVTDLFTGHLFRRVEVDETITPEQIEAFRRRRQVEEEEERQLEEGERLAEETKMSASNNGDETPLEPFYLDDLATRIEAMLASPAPSPEPEEPDGFYEPVRNDFSMPRKAATAPAALDSTPIPIPPKNPARQRRAQMPPIPELRVTVADEKPAPARVARGPFEAYEDDDFVFLRSTPCTLTMPRFQHGPIRIKKSDLEPVFEPDNTLDWTAFQMAILGAGDFFCEDPRSESFAEDEERAEVCDWFAGFGFETHGRLLTTRDENGVDTELAEPEPSPSSAEFSPVSSPSSCYSDEDLPIPLEAEYASAFRYGGSPALEECGIKRWSAQGRPKRYRRPSVDSLPQSPMMPIAGDEIVWGKQEVVPMGYNLGHDLGDFLRWEAENVYAVEVP